MNGVTWRVIIVFHVWIGVREVLVIMVLHVWVGVWLVLPAYFSPCPSFLESHQLPRQPRPPARLSADKKFEM